MKRTLIFSVLAWTSLSAGNALAVSPLQESQMEQQADVIQELQWKSHYSYPAAQALRRSGLWDAMAGHGPDEPMEREEFVKLLSQMTGKEPSRSDGEKDGGFTRAEAAKWVAAFTDLNTGVAGHYPPPFVDLPQAADVADAIRYVYQTGIMAGDGTRFYPDERLTRGQAAVVLEHVLMRVRQMAKEIPFTNVTNDLPAAVQSLADAHKTKAGLYSLTLDGYRYLVVTAGEKPTGGYSLFIDHVYETPGAIYLSVQERSPEPGTFVPMMITYPLAVIKIQETDKPVYLLEMAGDK
jgi:hypothetical protein